ncbi:MAG: hypothetical protein HYI21_08595 [Sediminibacterium sp. Gen4]|jgi:hypothetical protein|uniref:hypothetical protein n=1 Tax=unclassified Sediminibacterium TaxID=2635961 RepID=UPI0015BA112B|nr:MULTISPECIES: hypothetical protein [unclassified Sediminibacterium]MBW0162401.1 hypothetical protein [Sediminibacterium sp.]MBW0164609.1 hypothetical protein [Sediminibacterium sp.]MDZ4071116.1 hypothetical protein [Sediminibacterium sp.]NWK66071.1 hypothetical protein [Sediminibacterium sp. Gen4]
MPKSSNAAGKIKSLEEQKIELSQSIIALLESKKESNVKIHSLARQSVKERLDVLEGMGNKEYDFKSNFVSQLMDPSFVFDEEKSFASFKSKVSELLSIFPPDKRQTVNSYLQRHQEYIPVEIQSLMLATGKIDVSDCKRSLVEESIKMHVDHLYELEYHFIELCTKAFPSSIEADKIIDGYYPRIKWLGSTTDFAELMSTLKKNNWVDTTYASSVRQFANLCNFHFSLVGKKGQAAKYDAVKKAFDLQQMRVVHASKKRLERTQHDFKFNPLTIPINNSDSISE